MQADPQAISAYFERVHGSEPQGWLILWTRQDKATRAFDLRQEVALDEAVKYAARRAAASDVYAAVGLQAEAPPRGSRGKEGGVVALPGLWADIDIGGTAHKAKDLPGSEEEALSLVDAVGLPPSVVVRSGFGLQVYWLFREPFVIETEAERQDLKSLSRRFQQMLRLQARARGWTIDPTADLCRVLRVPGTFNRKIPDDVRPVTAEYFDRAYSIDDIAEILCGLDDPGEPAPSQPPPDLPPAKLPPILEGCAWMRHCRDDAATLPEPEWYRMLTVIARCEDAERWAHELSQPHPKYSRRETQRKLKQASGEQVAPVTCAYVEADLGGARFCDACLFRGNVNSPIAIGRLDVGSEAGESDPPEDAEPEDGDESDPPPPAVTAAASQIEHFTDLGNAKRFAARYRDRLLYCEKWTRWFEWDNMRWRDDETLEVYRLAGLLIRSLYPLAKRIRDDEERQAFLKHLARSESFRAQTALINLAKADPAFAVRPGDLDCDPWLLTLENGTLDLRTGKLRPHDQRDRITKLAPVRFDPTASCPNWLEFLHMVMGGNQRLVSFLQRAFGCCLTGITSDKAMFILYGASGDNGKSTMVDVIQLLLGDYAVRTPTETFLRKKDGAIPNDVAKLKGARFVWASENERGSRLSESLIKEMTGGDKLSARFMRGEFFEFYPEFKPWLATNHKPQVRGDRALWNRLKLIPFHVTIPKDRQKPRHEVMAMFRREFSGILNWALEGCLEWQRNGLGVPEEVVTATREYEAEQDTFAMFLEEKCVRAPNARVLSLALYREYKSWAEQYGESPVSHKMFASFMSERGFEKTKTNRGFLYSGIGLRTEDHYDTPRGSAPPRQTHLVHDEEGEEV
jgi:P4 family phage/plasmid primase-like protien